MAASSAAIAFDFITSTEPRPPELRLRCERGVNKRRLAVELERRALFRIVRGPVGQPRVAGLAIARERDPRVAAAPPQPLRGAGGAEGAARDAVAQRAEHDRQLHPVAGADPAADQRRPPREQITPYRNTELGEPIGRALRRVMKDAVALHRLPEPRRRAAPALRRAIHLEHCIGLDLAAELPCEPPAQVRLGEAPAARIEEREQTPLVPGG